MEKTFQLTDLQERWIRSRVESGEFFDDSDYIRDLIRRDQERLADVEQLRADLIQGEASGAAEPFDAESFKREMKAKHGAQGR